MPGTNNPCAWDRFLLQNLSNSLPGNYWKLHVLLKQLILPWTTGSLIIRVLTESKWNDFNKPDTNMKSAVKSKDSLWQFAGDVRPTGRTNDFVGKNDLPVDFGLHRYCSLNMLVILLFLLVCLLCYVNEMKEKHELGDWTSSAEFYWTWMCYFT